MAEPSGNIESLSKLEETPQGQRDRWSMEISLAEKENEKYIDQARRVQKRFIDNRDAVEVNQKWFNIFNTNVAIMEAALYANIPTVDVSRKFADTDDDTARVAANILQRAIQQDMTEPECDFDQVMRQCVSDRLIPGLGTAWLRLETETEQQDEDVDEEGNPLERISHQEIAIDYVFWEDFLWSPCRVWAERRWVARKVPMTRDALVKRFGEDVGKKIPLDYAAKGAVDGGTPKNEAMKRACIYEIWDREKRQVIWFCKGYEALLDTKDDPLGLDDFEPCPKPLFANLTTSSCIPKPDYAMLQDQYSELDETNNRISLLIVACKVVGVYDRASDGVQRMLQEGYDNTLIPVDNWAMFAEKGGVKGQVDWLPLDVVVQALGQLQAHREAVKGQIYELTGISDIVRGNTKASETLGAQELKSKFASIRIQKLQDEVARFAESMLRIKAEILVRHFDPVILAKMANAEFMSPEDQQLVPMALQLIKGNEEALEWRVTIQADAMATIDHARQKQERTDFLTAVATFLQSASTVGQGAPQLIPLMLEMLQFGVAGFKVGKDMEGTFDRYIKEFTDDLEAKKNAPPKPDPEMMKMQAEQQAEQQRMQMEMQGKQAEAQMDMQKQQADLAHEQARFEQEMMQERQKFQLELEMLQVKNAIALETARLDASVKIAQSRQNMTLRSQEAEQNAVIREKEESKDE